jgi:hypothetical protein
MKLHESQSEWRAHSAMLAERGVILPDVIGYATDELKRDYTLAMDAQPALTSTANSAVPAMLTSYIDPEVIRIAFAPVQAAKIAGERKTGDWLTDTTFFPVVEHTGEVTSYSDFSQTGSASVNTNWPQRQSYHFQIMKRYGERELERAGLARINWVSEIDRGAADILNRFSNYCYFYGVAGLQNYGLLNDPSLPASISPGTKAAGGGNVWLLSGGQPNATANEIYADIQALFYQLVTQSSGLITAQDSFVLAFAPGVSLALTNTNSFGVDVYKLLKQNFPNIRFEQAVQYGAKSSQNPEGIAAGNMVQLIAERIEGQETCFCAFTEKMRSHKIIPDTSSFKCKVTSGAWGAVIRRPFAFASMVGV